MMNTLSPLRFSAQPAARSVVHVDDDADTNETLFNLTTNASNPDAINSLWLEGDGYRRGSVLMMVRNSAVVASAAEAADLISRPGQRLDVLSLSGLNSGSREDAVKLVDAALAKKTLGVKAILVPESEPLEGFIKAGNWKKFRGLFRVLPKGWTAPQLHKISGSAIPQIHDTEARYSRHA